MALSTKIFGTYEISYPPTLVRRIFKSSLCNLQSHGCVDKCKPRAAQLSYKISFPFKQNISFHTLPPLAHPIQFQMYRNSTYYVYLGI